MGNSGLRLLLPLVFVITTLSSATTLAAPIHEAAASGNVEKVQRLVEADSTLLNLQDSGGATPLHHAVAGGHADIVTYLLSVKANVNAKKKDGVTPLHIAAAFGRIKIAELLLSGGAKADVQDLKKRTPLSIAQSRKDKAMCELLSDSGSTDPEATSPTSPAGHPVASGFATPPTGKPLFLWQEDDKLGSSARDLLIARLDSLPVPEVKNAQVATARLVSGEISNFDIAVVIARRMGIAFRGTSADVKTVVRLTRRVESIPTNDFASWREALGTALGHEIKAADPSLIQGYGTVSAAIFLATLGKPEEASQISLAWTLACLDCLFDPADRYQPAKASRYLTRLRMVRKDIVDSWISKLPDYQTIPDTAAVSITLVDGIFPNERFDQQALNKFLSQVSQAK